MKKKVIIFIILFVLILLFGFTIGSILTYFMKNGLKAKFNFTDVFTYFFNKTSLLIGLIVFIAYSIILGAGILVTGGLTLGFVIPLMKLDGKKWYSIAIMVVAIIAIALAILAFVMIFVVTKVHNDASSSSSSSEAISESAKLLLSML